MHILILAKLASSLKTLKLVGANNSRNNVIFICSHHSPLHPQLDAGYLQLRYDLGSGPAVARLGGSKVEVAKSHTVSVHRTGRTAEVMLDDTFLAVATSPGMEGSLEFEASDIYVGGLPGQPSAAFAGCIWGTKLGHRDLPPSGENAHFIATPSGEVESACSLMMSPPGLSEAARAVLISGGSFALGIMAALSVILCLGLWRWRRRKRRRTYHANLGGGELQFNSGNSLVLQHAESIKKKNLGSEEEKADDSVSSGSDHGNVPLSSASVHETEFGKLSPDHPCPPDSTLGSQGPIPTAPPAYDEVVGLQLHESEVLQESSQHV